MSMVNVFTCWPAILELLTFVGTGVQYLFLASFWCLFCNTFLKYAYKRMHTVSLTLYAIHVWYSCFTAWYISLIFAVVTIYFYMLPCTTNKPNLKLCTYKWPIYGAVSGSLGYYYKGFTRIFLCYVYLLWPKSILAYDIYKWKKITQGVA